MARVYAIGAGYRVQVGGFGFATETVPAIVPEDVADGLRGRSDLRIEEGGGRAHVAVDNGDKAAIELEAEDEE